MIVARHVAHVHSDLTVVDFTAVATPLALHPHRMRTTLWKAARIKGDHAIGFPQPLSHLSDQHLEQRAMIPGRRADERDRKSTRLNSSHVRISYAVFCLKKKTTTAPITARNTPDIQMTTQR